MKLVADVSMVEMISLRPALLLIESSVPEVAPS